MRGEKKDRLKIVSVWMQLLNCEIHKCMNAMKPETISSCVQGKMLC